MDVTCEHCGAEYEFDETLLDAKGTTVKCSACRHVFRVAPTTPEQASPLRVRFAEDGSVEPLASLRALQQRIQAGEISPNDQVGRAGSAFRRLGDVPELRGFFRAASSDAGTLRPSSAPQAQAGQAHHEPRSAGREKRTVLGVGPGVQVPPAPRLPTGVGNAAQQPAASHRPAPIHAAATVQGHFPSSIPTAGHQAPRAPISSAPTVPGESLAAAGGAPRPSAIDTDAATVSSGFSLPSEAPRAMPSSNPAPGARSTLGSSLPAGEPSPGPAAAPQVRLYLSDDDAPPDRATQGSTKFFVYLIAFLLLGGVGYFGIRALTQNLQDAQSDDPSIQAAPEANAPAELGTSTDPSAGEPNEATEDAATEAVDAAPAPESQAHAAEQAEPQAGRDEPEPSQAAEEPAAAKAEKAPSQHKGEPRAAAPSRARASAGSQDPDTYGGWVARGDQLFSRGDLSGAREAFQQAVALRGTGSEANSGLGFVLLAQGKPKEALPFLRRASGNGFAEASIGLGDAYRKLGRKDEAVDAYEAYLARLPKGARASYAQRQIDALGGGDPPTQPAGEARTEQPTPAAQAEPEPYRPAGELAGESDEEASP